MILIVKYNEFEYKDEILDILKNSKIKFGKIKHNRYENIDLIVPRKHLTNIKDKKDILENIAKRVYVEIHKYKFGKLNIKSFDSNIT